MTSLCKVYKDNHYREFTIEDMANFKGIGELLYSPVEEWSMILIISRKN